MTIHEVNMLAMFNAEEARGLVHTEEWKEHMKELQRKYKLHLQAMSGMQNTPLGAKPFGTEL
jgi:hypothetical protein